MSSRRERAARFLLAALGALLGAAVHAADADALLELVIDGRATEQVARFVIRDGMPHASASEWRALGLRLPERLAADEAALLSVAALPGVQSRFDAAAQTLSLVQAPDPASLQVIDAQTERGGDEAPSDMGAMLNYDLSTQNGRGGGSSAALLEARLFGGRGLFEQTLIASDALHPHAIRLDSTYTHVDARQLRRLRVGDFIPVALAWTRPVRMGGVQLMTDFALRPDLVTAPLPVLGGSAAVASTVDVFVNGVRQLSQPVDAGRFEVRQMPVVSGLGEVAVVVRDALGRESVQRLPFYSSARQLAGGLSAYSLEFGRVRRGYALAGNDYGDAAASASLRHGASDRLTVEAHAEAVRGVALAGGGGVLNVGDLGLLSAALASSRGGAGGGLQASLGAERQSSLASVNVALTRASAGYRDIAAAQGDAVLRRSARLGAGLTLGALGNLGIALIASESAPALLPATRTRVASGTYSVALASGRAQAFVTAYRDLMPGGGQGVSLGLTLPLGERGAVSASLAHERGGSIASVQVGESALLAGDFGWRLQDDERLSGSVAATRRLVAAEYRASWARVGAEAEQIGGAAAARLGVQGSLIALGGRLHASLPVTDSLAVVALDGQPDVAVYHENRLVGRTDAEGQIVVPGLLSHQLNRIAIDPLDLPIDADAEQLAREVRPSERAGVVVRFALRRSRSALLVLRDASGAPLPLGALATLAGGTGGPFVVGHDGLAYVSGLAEHNELAVRWGREQACAVRFELATADLANARIGPLQCR